MSHITFRLADEEDMQLFQEIRGEKLPKLHMSRIRKQEKDEAEYFLVFQDGKPVGHIFIHYRNKGYPYPLLEDLFVKKESRKQGIAKEILVFAEKCVRRKEFQKVGIDVGIDAGWLRRFYEKMGYSVVGEVHTITPVIEGRQVSEEVYHLKKEFA